MKLIGKSGKNASVETLRARYLELLRLREFVQRLEDQFQATAPERFRTAPQYKPRPATPNIQRLHRQPDRRFNASMPEPRQTKQA
jgi:hypothetical protein